PGSVRASSGKSARTAASSAAVRRSCSCTAVTACSARLGRGEVAVVALFLEPLGELGAALLGDLAVDEDVHEVGLDVPQDARVVRDEHDARVGRLAHAVDTLGHDAQRVDVEARVGLVEDRELGLEQLELEDLVALLLTAREALVDRARGER